LQQHFSKYFCRQICGPQKGRLPVRFGTACAFVFLGAVPLQMKMIQFVQSFDWQLTLRLLSALGAGLLLGFERESHGRAAGLRTTVMVSLAASCAMILSDVFYRASFVSAQPPVAWHPDPARLAAGVLAGIGFIGGGVIIHQGNLIRGVTTASVLWFVTVIGLCFGAGQFALGFAATALSFFTLIAMPYLEKLAPNDWYGTLIIKCRGEGVSIPDISAVLREHNIGVKSVDVHHDVPTAIRTMKFALKFKKRDLVGIPSTVVSALARRPTVIEVGWS
jgi:putative Mg2+ transporter-C (MgtC) family protein